MRYEPGNSALDKNILVSCSQLLPNADGSYRAPYPAVATSYDQLNLVPAAFLSVYPGGTGRLFAVSNNAGTLTIQEATGGGTTWTSRKTLSGSGTPHFCQYRDETIAVNNNTSVSAQTSTTGNFSNLTNAPNALVVATVDDRLCFWNYSISATQYSDGFMASDVGNNTQYTPADSNQAYNTRVTDTPGPGTAMIRFRDFLVLFKRRGMYLAMPVGRPEIWDIRLISADVGCVGKDACIVAGDTLYFVDDQNVYSFDGAIVRSISDPYHTKTILSSLIPGTVASIENTQLHYDDLNKVLSLYLAGSTGRPTFFCYNTVSGLWGFADTTNGTEVAYCMLNAPFKDLVAFTGLGVTASSNENRVGFYSDTISTNKIRNGHNSATAGAAATAWFGNPFKASTLSRVYLNADDNTGITVAATMKRSPRSSGSTQASAAAASFSSDLIADLMVNGNFCQLTYAWNAQTNGSPAAFRKWLDHIPEIR